MSKTRQELIGVEKAAEILGKKPRTTQNLAKAGEIPVFMKMPGETGAYLFDRAEIEKLAVAS